MSAVPQAAPAGIRAVVFDVGWVFVRFDYQPILDFLRAHGAVGDDLHRLLAQAHLAEHETGRMHGQALLESLAGLATRPVDLAALRALWVGMFELEPPMVDLAHRLAERYRVYLLSNIGDLHWAYLSREHRLHAIGHGALPSYLAGVMKPDAGIYAEAERRFALTPQATVFIDDRADNIEAARARGWHGIVHRDHADTVRQLQGLGVEC
ncbi:MAG TPA: HAD family phosphatase [Steroidobacteraceae bacterium]|nr:HAD family phosphatase [Steroidobacteraceae bacterium]